MPMFASLYNFAHWLTHNREEAEDLVQETYLKALKGFVSFQPGTNFRAWMYRILRNTFLTSRKADCAARPGRRRNRSAGRYAGGSAPRACGSGDGTKRPRTFAGTISRGNRAVRYGGDELPGDC